MNKLTNLRKKIDKVDSDLVRVIAKRFRITGKVKIFKLGNGLPREDKNREIEVMDKGLRLAKKLNLNPELIERVLILIIAEAKKQ